MMDSDTMTNDWGALGQARIDDAAAAAGSPDVFAEVMGRHAHPFPFTWGSCWNAVVEYRVADFAAEAGFFLDALGFEANAFCADYCMVTPPDRSCFFSFRPTRDGEEPSPPTALTLAFMVADIEATADELAARGVPFTEPAGPLPDGGGVMWKGTFTTPNGIPVELWGMVQPTAPDADAGGRA